MRPKNRRKLHSSEQGTAIIEMTVVLVILSILTMAAGGVFSASQDSLDWHYHALALQKELRRTLSTMSQEIREASPSSPIPITTGTNTITFQIPSSVAANVVTSWKQITYTLSGTNAIRTIDSSTNTIGSSVQSMTFTYPASASLPRTVQIQITGRRDTLKRSVTVTLTNQVMLRN